MTRLKHEIRSIRARLWRSGTQLFWTAALSLLMGGGFAQAATITVWHNEVLGAAVSNNVTITMEGERCRIDYSELLTVLIHADTAYAYHLLHPTKTYVRQPLSQIQRSSPCMDATNAHPVATGRSLVIGTNKAQEYRMTNACGQRLLWVAPDYPEWKGLTAAMSPTLAALAGHAALPAERGLPGMIVRSETITAQKDAMSSNARSASSAAFTTNSQTLVSARFVPQNSALFEIPPGYRQVKAFPSAPSTNDALVRIAAQERAHIAQLNSTNSNPLSSLDSGAYASESDWLQGEGKVPRGAGPATRDARAPSEKNVFALSTVAWGEPLRTLYMTNMLNTNILKRAFGTNGDEHRHLAIKQNATNKIPAVARKLLDSARESQGDTNR